MVQSLSTNLLLFVYKKNLNCIRNDALKMVKKTSSNYYFFNMEFSEIQLLSQRIFSSAVCLKLNVLKKRVCTE